MELKNSSHVKLLYIMEYLVMNTDEDHQTNANIISNHLKKFGMTIERKAVYRSIGMLNQAGIEISRTGSSFYYVPNKGDIFHAFADSKLQESAPALLQ